MSKSVPSRAVRTINAAVEGIVDEAVVRRLAEDAHLQLDAVYGKRGKSYLKAKVGGYNNAARFGTWLVLVDLDSETSCAPELRREWLSQPSDGMHFRVAVREVEAWLLGDVERIAAFLRVNRSKVPARPEQLPDPKDAIIRLAKESRSREIRDLMIPRLESGRKVGPGYGAKLIQFALDTTAGWRPAVAALHSESLRRCLEALHRAS